MLRSSQSGKLTPAEEATLSAMSPQDLYTFATSGQPVIDDHLDQPQNSQWRDEQKNQGKSSCTFRTVSGTTAYHLTVQHGAPPAVCFARNGNFSNFAFQISVRESLNDYQNDSQSAVGIAFCANNTGNTFKLFSAATFSGYSFIHYQAGNANLVTSGIPSVPILTPGSNDQLTVVAHNGHFAFYLNGHFIVSQNEAACSGSIGIFTGAPMNTSSEFVFSDARVWQL